MMHFCSVPYIYTLEITSACNASCAGCGNVFPHDNSYITPKNCQVVLERISPYVEMVRITGGEPTLSPAFAEVMQAVDGLGKPIVVFTNGFWSDPQAVIKVLQECLHLDGILVSLHGHTYSSYKAFTGGDHFSNVLSSIRQASEANITVNTNTILTHENVDHMAEVIELAMQAGVQVVAFSRYYGAPIPGLTDLSAEQLRFALRQVTSFRAAGKPVKFNNNIPLCFGGELTQACPIGDTHCTISPDYKVRACNHSPDEIGDILKTPIEQIWQSDLVRQLRVQIPAMCKQCMAFEFCGAGCRANAGANKLKVDPLACGPYLTHPQLTSIHHALHSGSVPRSFFSLRKESFGYVLINRAQIIKVSKEARPLIDVLMQGNMTLSEIGERFGQKALNFIGLLYDYRMIGLTAERVSSN